MGRRADERTDDDGEQPQEYEEKTRQFELSGGVSLRL
jgi:hypothetical protein